MQKLTAGYYNSIRNAVNNDKSENIPSTLGARDVSCPVSGFSQIFRVTRACLRPATDTEASPRPREKSSGAQATPRVEELKRTTYLRNKSSFVEVIKQFRIMKSDQLRKHR